METVAAAATWTVVALLLTSSLHKLVNPKEIGAVITRLVPGLPANRHVLIGRLLGATEFSGALFIALAPSAVGGLLSATFGTVFASAGMLALRSGERLKCNCFGSSRSSGDLGWRQIMALPVWLVAGAAVSFRDHSTSSALVTLAVGALAVTVLSEIPFVRESVRLRSLPLAAERDPR